MDRCKITTNIVSKPDASAAVISCPAAMADSKESALRREAIDHSADTDKTLEMLTTQVAVAQQKAQAVVDLKAQLAAQESARVARWTAQVADRAAAEELAWCGSMSPSLRTMFVPRASRPNV